MLYCTEVVLLVRMLCNGNVSLTRAASLFKFVYAVLFLHCALLTKGFGPSALSQGAEMGQRMRMCIGPFPLTQSPLPVQKIQLLIIM